jgi:hypothetical protein
VRAMTGGGLMSVAPHNRVRVRVPVVGFIVGEVRRIWEEGAVAGLVVGGGAGGGRAAGSEEGAFRSRQPRSDT